VDWVTAAISDSPIIIIEGSDGTGKSVLAAELAQRDGRVGLHAGPPTSDNWTDEYVNCIPPSTWPLVLDRWHIGEFIWPQFFGRKSLFSDSSDLRQCHNWLVENGAWTIVLVRPITEIVIELSRRGESEEAAITAVEGQESYMDVVRSAHLDNTIMTTLPAARKLLGLS
jgi:hypothetical protein